MAFWRGHVSSHLATGEHVQYEARPTIDDVTSVFRGEIVELRDRLDVASSDAAGSTNHDGHVPHLVSILDLRTKFNR